MDFLMRLQAIYPQARPVDITTLGPFLVATMDRYAIDRPLRQAHFLAQVGHESGQLRYREEIASGDAYDTRADLGNTPARDGDGRLYKGRGGIGCTGKANYSAYDQHRQAGGLLVREPWRVGTDPELFCDVAGWYWDVHQLNPLADADNARLITKRINGGYNGLADRLAILERAKRVLLPNRDDVRRLQVYLNGQSAAPRLAVDGDFGGRTRAALEAFLALGGQLPAGLARAW